MSDQLDLLLSPIRTVRRRLDAGELSPVELTRAALDRIEAVNPHLGAFTHVAAEQALASAQASERRLARGEGLGPLDGIPVGVKDLVATEGMPLEAGSDVLAGHVADRDAAAVTSLRRAGAVILGKVSLDEFALTTVGPARNPLDDDLMAGGSSGGSAVAVAAGMCFAAIGTDTGGSVRVPAECCAVTGLKPTQGLLPTEGVIPLAPSLDHVGTLARTVDDTALFLEALLPARPVGLDVTGGGEAARRSRIGIPADLTGYDPDVQARFLAAIDRASSQGAAITRVELPDLQVLKGAHWAILAAEIADYHLARFGPDEKRYGQPMLDAIAAGAAVSVAEYLDAQETRGALRRQVDGLFADVDILALPTMVIDPPRYGQASVRVAGVDDDPTAAMVRGTSLFNHTGHPALSVPPATSPRDRPAGIQLVAPHLAERRLLTVAHLFES
ncbi:amidase [Pseudonocardia acaciae]|uniref:amidase n=1 Tax=Pseudonocardia acaciae TaxID=551276 RepID=UPI00048DA423|nr:amidase [Pseudonocardia acaciae]